MADDKNTESMLNASEIAALSAKIVSGYVSCNTVEAAELPKLVGEVFNALKTATAKPAAKPELVPAVPINKSITHDFIVCLEDGKRLKILKRHIMAAFNMTPDQYREKWGLPRNYPMVAPAYSERRSKMVKGKGVGRQPLEAA